MNSVDTFHKRLREEIAAVEKEIQSHNQHVESLTHRLKGLRRADELFESDQAAIAELLQTGIPNGSGLRTAAIMSTRVGPPFRLADILSSGSTRWVVKAQRRC